MGRNLQLCVSQAFIFLLDTTGSVHHWHCFFASMSAGLMLQGEISCTCSEAAQSRLIPRGCRRVSFTFLKWLWRRRLQSQSQFWHLDHSRTEPPHGKGALSTCTSACKPTMTNSCYMDDIYCCDSFTIALSAFSLPVLIIKTRAVKKTFSDLSVECWIEDGFPAYSSNRVVSEVSLFLSVFELWPTGHKHS